MPSSDSDGWFSGFRDAMQEHERERPAEERTIGRYDLVARIGEGATAVVYRALDRTLNRFVALKVLRESVAADERMRRRFLREAKAAAKLSHPNVVPIYDAGDEGGRMYLAMELETERFDHHLAQERERDLPLLVHGMEKVAAGVQHAHEHGIVHRDLKPGNILLGRDGEPKVADFGLALLAESQTALTRTGASVGTPSYMAPELVQGRVDEIGIRSDVYALGAILYEALTGRPPHTASTVIELYGKIVGEDPVPPRTIAPSCPADLESVVLRALEKNPADRYASAREFEEELRRYRNGEPVWAQPASNSRRLWRKIRRHQSRLLTICAVTLLAAGLVIATRQFFSTPPRESHQAYRLLEIARASLDRAERCRYQPEASYEGRVRFVDEAMERIEEAIVQEPELSVAHYLQGRAWELKGYDEKAEACWRKTLQLDDGFAPARFRLARMLVERSIHTTLGEGEQERIKGIHRSAGYSEEAQRLLEQTVSQGSGLESRLQLEVARVIVEHNRGKEDEEIVRLANEGLRNFGNEEGSEEFHWLIGLSLPARESIPHLERAVDRCPGHRIARFFLAFAREASGDPKGAQKEYDALIQGHPRFAPAYINRGRLRHLGRDLDGALSDYEAALRLDPSVAGLHYNLGLVRQAKEDVDGAISEFDEALRLDPDFYRVLLDRGRAWFQKGVPERALEDYDDVLRRNPRFSDAYVNRANVHLSGGRRDKARADLKQALATSPPDWPYRAGIERMLNDLPEE